MFHTPAHKQADPAKQGAQRVNPIGGVTAREAHRAAFTEKLDAACARPLGGAALDAEREASRSARIARAEAAGDWEVANALRFIQTQRSAHRSDAVDYR